MSSLIIRSPSHFEGDSGPYLQYSAVRAAAVLEKAEKEGVKVAKNSAKVTLPEKSGLLEKLIVRFPDIVARAQPNMLRNILPAI